MSKIQIVIPCYNESQRFDQSNIDYLVSKDFDITLVNDGSTDNTLEILKKLHGQYPKSVTVLDLPKNMGKANAVREGMRQALNTGAPIVGYTDADFATPAQEVAYVLEDFLKSNVKVVLGSRVQLLGRQIKRAPLRHYLGRIFATIASIKLGIPVYDTQCGLKFFRADPRLDEALLIPFKTKWIFDVELISRLLSKDETYGSQPMDLENFYEFPLRQWKDVSGSKLGFGAMIKAGFSLLFLK